MTWEETIKLIRTKPEYKELVEKAYFEEDLTLNIERFSKSEEFIETLRFLKLYAPNAKKILDIGSGNGVSAVAFALQGYFVTSIEPDKSDTIGAGAIKKLKTHYKLDNLEVYEAFAEEINFPDNNFDIVYARQCMHHAYDLDKFVLEASRVLKNGGLFFTVRDHVVYNDKDKEWFLKNHPLQHFYGGENAFSEKEYLSAIKKSGLNVKLVMKHFDNVINYFPITKAEKIKRDGEFHKQLTQKVKQYYGIYSIINLFSNVLIKKVKHMVINPNDEENVPGRMYSFIALKP